MMKSKLALSLFVACSFVYAHGSSEQVEQIKALQKAMQAQERMFEQMLQIQREESAFLRSQINPVAQNEALSFFYDEATQTEWVEGKQSFTNLVIDAPHKNYVFAGDFSASCNIDITAKNLLILGKLLAVKNIRLTTTQDCFNAGVMMSEALDISAVHSYNGIDNEACARIRALGIDMAFTDPDHKKIRITKPDRVLAEYANVD